LFKKGVKFPQTLACEPDAGELSMAVENIPVQATPFGLGTALSSYKTVLATATMHLTQFPFVPSSSSTYADLLANEASYPGYTAPTVGPATGPFPDQAGRQVLLLVRAVFAANLATPAGNITGGWVQSAANAPEFVFTFAQPLTVGTALGATLVLDAEVDGVVTGTVERVQ
jgi:hypothetical protein